MHRRDSDDQLVHKGGERGVDHKGNQHPDGNCVTSPLRIAITTAIAT